MTASRTLRRTLRLLAALCVLWSAARIGSVCAAEKWVGVDESVVEKIAKEHGREKRKSLIDTDQGDLLLFVFLVAGTLAGFAAGYYWRILMVERAPGRRAAQSGPDGGEG